MISSDVSMYHQILLNWFRSGGRDFPWRQTSNPFHILIAEILMRKTGASRVISAYEYLTSRYPTPSQMADAPLETLECIIGSLGLRSRAKTLIKLSQTIQEHYNGTIPSNSSDLRRLPGVGHYIANAVACFSFGYARPLVDGGIGRVIRRVFDLPHTKPAYIDKELWTFAMDILPTTKARDYNLALIDLSALLCKPRNPKCSSCPLQGLCVNCSRRGENR